MEQVAVCKKRLHLSETQTNILVCFIYFVFLAIVISFHESWFDEAQSWLIARDASYHDMLFVIPHYEGHPPLWWLILSIPAKLGVPYEFGLKGINVIFSVLAEYLLLFKSPFPKWIRYPLPFSYFLFYQYGVISRPYSIMACAFFLCAIGWEKRNEKPFRFVLPLMLLCLTSAYGILIAGGLAAVWVLELLKERSLFEEKRRFISLFSLLSLAVLLLCFMLPKEDTFAEHLHYNLQTNSLLQRLLLFLFCLPAETSFTAYGPDDLLILFRPSMSDIVVMFAFSALVWFGIFVMTRKKGTFTYVIVPYAILTAFGAVKYFHMHHLGILYLLFLFAAWISLKNENLMFSSRWKRITTFSFIGLGLMISLFWSTFSVITDIKSAYSPGKSLAELIEQYDLGKYRWTSLWDRDFDDNSNMIYENTHTIHGVVAEANPYFHMPITGIQGGGTSYNDHVIPSSETMAEEIKALRNRGTDIIIGIPTGGNYLEDLNFTEKAKLMWVLKTDKVWKSMHAYKDTFIVLRLNLAEKIGA